MNARVRRLDLNCDLGESFGAWRMGADEAVLPWVSSASVACGFHAGDAHTMRRTVRACRAHGVAVGAHVSYPDLQGFGRRSMVIEPSELEDLTIQQIATLAGFAKVEGVTLAHVKPHGALYNDAADDATRATAIARAVRAFDPALKVYALAGSPMLEVLRAHGLAAVPEAFADRAYMASGRLRPRRETGAVLEKPEAAAVQLEHWLQRGSMPVEEGRSVAVEALTVCVHGDRPDALRFARLLAETLDRHGVERAPP